MHLPVKLSTGAPVGTWTIEVKADPGPPPIGRAEFRVDAFVPDRMAVELGPRPAAIVPGKTVCAAGRRAVPVWRARCRPDRPGAAAAGDRSGAVPGARRLSHRPDRRDLRARLQGPAGAGHRRAGPFDLPIAIPRAPDTTHALKASITVGVNDPSGHASLATTEIPLRPAGKLLGIKPAFADGAIDAGTEAAFDIAAVGPDGARVRGEGEAAAGARAARLAAGDARQPGALRDGVARRAAGDPGDRHPRRRAVPLRPQARLRPLPHRGAGRWRHGRHLHALPRRLGLVRQPGRAGPGGCLRRSQVYAPGGTARIHIAPPFAGEATLLVLSDRVHSVRNLSVPAGGTDVDVPVSADWGPGAYVTVHVFRPAADAQIAPRPRHRADLGRHRSWRTQAAGGVRRGRTSTRRAPAPRSGCRRRPAPGSASPRWTRASCG